MAISIVRVNPSPVRPLQLFANEISFPGFDHRFSHSRPTRQKDVRQKDGDSYFSVLHFSVWRPKRRSKPHSPLSKSAKVLPSSANRFNNGAGSHNSPCSSWNWLTRSHTFF